MQPLTRLLAVHHVVLSTPNPRGLVIDFYHTRIFDGFLVAQRKIWGSAHGPGLYEWI